MIRSNLVRLAKISRKPLLAFINPNNEGTLDKSIRFDHFMYLRKMLLNVESDSVGVLIHTRGGDGNAAAKIASMLRSQYVHLRGYIPYFSYSAGTIISLAFDEIVMGEFSNIGPIDQQDAGKSEKGFNSTLEIFAGMDGLRDFSLETFTKALREIQTLTEDNMSPADDLKAATEYAIRLAGIFAKDFSTKELGRCKRALQESEDYARNILQDNPVYSYDDGREMHDSKINNIIKKLVYSISGHSYPIMRVDADAMGLPVVYASNEEQAIFDDLAYLFGHMSDDMLVLIDPANKVAYEIEDGFVMEYALKDFK